MDVTKVNKILEIAKSDLFSEQSNISSDQYKSVNDAAEVTGDGGYKRGNTEIWYMNEKGWEEYPLGGKFAVEKKSKELPPIKNPGALKTHVLVGKISANHPEKAWMMMQGEHWSPNGEARNLIRSLGLSHTSMSAGDIVKIGNKAWMVDQLGMYEIKG